MSDIRSLSVSWEKLNIKTRIDTLLFDILLDTTFVPQRLANEQKKHNHSTFELHFIISGSGIMTIDGKEINLEPNSMHLIGPNIFHSIQPMKSDPIIRCSIRFSFKDLHQHDSWFPRTEAEEMKAALSQVSYFQFVNTDRNKLIRRLIEEIRMEIEEPSLGSYTNIQSFSAQLIVHLVRSIQPEGYTDDRHRWPNKTRDELRNCVIDQFFTDYKENLTIESLALKLNLSAKQVNRILQQHYNTTFKQKLLDTRVEVAKDLLRANSLTVQRISEEIGYKASPYFCRIFLLRTGMTPSQYRKMYREE